MKNLFAILTLIITFNSCVKNSCEPVPITDYIATQNIAPVCGCNIETYLNKVYAETAHVDYTNGACLDNIKDFVGKWEFLGFYSEGARIGKPTKEHNYNDMSIEFTNQYIDPSFEYFGMGVLNSFAGSYFTNTSKNISFFRQWQSSYVQGDQAQMRYEEKFIGAIRYVVDLESFFEGDYLRIGFHNLTDSLIYDNLIFKRER